ncbi:MAG: phage holin family protein [Cytophagales bacterium]|nr:phage holin family protein [Cytophagales bacterium]
MRHQLITYLGRFRRYVQVRLILAKWRWAGEAYRFLYAGFFFGFLCLLIGVAGLFLSLGLAFGLNSWWGSPYWGYICVGLLHILGVLFCYALFRSQRFYLYLKEKFLDHVFPDEEPEIENTHGTDQE